MNRLKTIALVLAGLGALALGGAAFAPADINPAKGDDDDQVVTGPAADRAGAAAVRALGGGTVRSVERSDDGGRGAYEVEVRRGTVTHEVELDADGREVGREIEDENEKDDDDDRD